MYIAGREEYDAQQALRVALLAWRYIQSAARLTAKKGAPTIQLRVTLAITLTNAPVLTCMLHSADVIQGGRRRHESPIPSRVGGDIFSRFHMSNIGHVILY